MGKLITKAFLGLKFNRNNKRRELIERDLTTLYGERWTNLDSKKKKEAIKQYEKNEDAYLNLLNRIALLNLERILNVESPLITIPEFELKFKPKTYTPSVEFGPLSDPIYELSIPIRKFSRRNSNKVAKERTFNEAFAEARRKGLKTFEFNGKLYGTELGNNPNWKVAGDARKEVTGNLTIILPIK